MGAGQPTIFTTELATDICSRIASSDKGLRAICKELGISVSSVMNWLRDADKKEFLEQYARAKQDQADFIFDQIIEIADDDSEDEIEIDLGDDMKITKQNHEFIARSRLRVDARKFVVARLAPKKYGEKVDVTTNGENLNSADLSSLSFEQLQKLANDGAGTDTPSSKD